jgi:argininosuccinate lyase
MAAAAADELLAATDVADLLVRRGVPFREAHRTVSSLVRTALERGKRLSELDPGEVAELAPALRSDGATARADDDFYALLRANAWLESKISEGGTSLVRVRDQLGQARHVLQELVP